MSEKPLKIPKALQPVTMWVHPEGLVVGSIFVAIGKKDGELEDPALILNDSSPFLVLQREGPDELRFYNRSSIVRVEYVGETPDDKNITSIPCVAHMMDGSVIDGNIIENLPNDYSRLYDYLNHNQERFIRLHTSDDNICMINKTYIVRVTSK